MRPFATFKNTVSNTLEHQLDCIHPKHVWNNYILFVVLQTLPTGLRFPCNVALEAANREKNRYKDIYACIHFLYIVLTKMSTSRWLLGTNNKLLPFCSFYHTYITSASTKCYSWQKSTRSIKFAFSVFTSDIPLDACMHVKTSNIQILPLHVNHNIMTGRVQESCR